LSSSPRLPIALGVCVVLGALVTGCGGGSSSSSDTLTLYSAQHDQMTDALVKGFEQQTGATVKVRSGEDEGLANQVVQEGSASPADVLLTENTPPLELLAEKGLLAKIDSSTLSQVPAQYSSPDGDWVGVAARETVLIYNPDLVPQSELPKSILDLAQPQWKGKLAIAPSEPDFVPIVSAITKLDGADAAKSWLEGFAANAKRYNDNEGIVAAVDDGQVAAGIVNHYYWFEAVAEQGKEKVPSRLYYFGNKDPGALVNISGAGVLESSKNQDLAQKFVAYMVSKEGQSAMTHSGDWQYPLNAHVAAPPGVKPFNELDPPDVTPADLGDGSEPLQLMQQAGLL
jgi:iron(III) transport system substrate-binding protein